ncbi:MAG: NAD(P)/FAD-dependent oxidoreductase [Parvibaculaceae bacterium]
MRLYEPSAYDFSRPVDSHWEATAGPLGFAPEALSGGTIADVAIIGGGYTGLHAALRLTRDFGMDTVVLEAGHIGWGASGRNGGFCCLGSSKLSPAETIAKFGLDAARSFHDAQRQAVEHVEAFLAEHGIDADRTDHGELQLAHKPNRIRELKEEQAFLKATFGVRHRFLDREELAARGTAGPLFHAGLLGPLGFGLHPLKYLRGLARVAHGAGVRLLPGSAVTGWCEEAGLHVLSTPQGDVRAKHVLVATNGFTDEAIPPELSGTLLPALSTIIVTRRLTDAERAAQGWTSTLVSYDTRNLLHYFRLLPSGHFLFGGRGGTSATPEALAAFARRLRSTFEAMFPAWAHIETEHRWSGLVCLTLGRTPYAGPIPGRERSWLSAAYHGNGVAMASHAGARMADLIAGRLTYEQAFPAVMRVPPARFPLPGLRRALLRAVYLGFGLRDEWL